MCHDTQLLQPNPKYIMDTYWHRTRVNKFKNSIQCNHIKYVILRGDWHLILRDLAGQTTYPPAMRSLGCWCVPPSCHCPNILFLAAFPQIFLSYTLCPLSIKKEMTFSINLGIITSVLAFLLLIKWDWELNVYYLILIMYILDLDI